VLRVPISFAIILYGSETRSLPIVAVVCTHVSRALTQNPLICLEVTLIR
jgi:hypothetical protein